MPRGAGFLLHKLRVCDNLKDVISKEKKAKLIEKARKHEKDTGSAQVQVAVLSERINELAEHLKKNKKDNHSRQGLLQMVADRRAHLSYLEKNDKKAYEEISKKFNLKTKN